MTNIGYCLRLFLHFVSPKIYEIKNLWKFKLNWSNESQTNIGGKNHSCVTHFSKLISNFRKIYFKASFPHDHFIPDNLCMNMWILFSHPLKWTTSWMPTVLVIHSYCSKIIKQDTDWYRVYFQHCVNNETSLQGGLSPIMAWKSPATKQSNHYS